MSVLAPLVSVAFPLLVELALEATLVLVLTEVLIAFLPGLSAARRCALRSSALVLLLLLPLTSLCWPASLHMRTSLFTVEDRSLAFTSEQAAPSRAPVLTPGKPPALGGGVFDEVQASDASPAGESWRTIAVMLWLSGFLILQLRLLVSWRAARRWIATIPLASDRRLQAAASRLANELGLSRSPRVRCGSLVRVPMTHGFWRSRILLPVDAARWTDEALSAVLRHELSHVVRRDGLVRSTARLVGTIYWFHPLVALLRCRLIRDQELACDDRVLQAGVGGTDYAEILVRFARRLHRPVPALALSSSQGLSQRIDAALDESRPRAPWSRPGLMLMAASVVAGGMLLGAVDASPGHERAAAPSEAAESVGGSEPIGSGRLVTGPLMTRWSNATWNVAAFLDGELAIAPPASSLEHVRCRRGRLWLFAVDRTGELRTLLMSGSGDEPIYHRSGRPQDLQSDPSWLGEVLPITARKLGVLPATVSSGERVAGSVLSGTSALTVDGSATVTAARWSEDSGWAGVFAGGEIAVRTNGATDVGPGGWLVLVRADASGGLRMLEILPSVAGSGAPREWPSPAGNDPGVNEHELQASLSRLPLETGIGGRAWVEDRLLEVGLDGLTSELVSASRPLVRRILASHLLRSDVLSDEDRDRARERLKQLDILPL